MPNYRRFYAPNTCYFFTVVTYNRQHLFSDENTVNLFKQSIRTIKRKYPFSMEAIVILPNHIHCIWQMHEEDIDYSKRWQFIKMHFTKLYTKLHNTNNIGTSSRFWKRERMIWQRRFWDHRIRDETDLYRHFDYIHYNPVKHGYAKSPKDWKWSSFHTWVKQGWYDEDWGAMEPDNLLTTCVGE